MGAAGRDATDKMGDGEAHPVTAGAERLEDLRATVGVRAHDQEPGGAVQVGEELGEGQPRVVQRVDVLGPQLERERVVRLEIRCARPLEQHPGATRPDDSGRTAPAGRAKPKRHPQDREPHVHESQPGIPVELKAPTDDDVVEGTAHAQRHPEGMAAEVGDVRLDRPCGSAPIHAHNPVGAPVRDRPQLPRGIHEPDLDKGVGGPRRDQVTPGTTRAPRHEMTGRRVERERIGAGADRHAPPVGHRIGWP